jgi:hypothetical protein
MAEIGRVTFGNDKGGEPGLGPGELENKKE